MNRIHQTVAAALLWLVALPAFAGSTLTFTSAAGDVVGQGTKGTWTEPTALFSPGGTSSDFYMQVSQPGGESFTFRFTALPGQVLGRGAYLNAENSNFRVGHVPGISIQSPSATFFHCRKAWGNFYIRQIAFDDDGQIVKFVAAFKQRCGAANAPMLSGTLHWNAEPQSLAASSAAGDPIGGGVNRTYLGSASNLTLIGDQYTLFYRAAGLRDTLDVAIYAPYGQTLAPGTYPLLFEYTPRPPNYVGADISHHDGTRCDALTGTVVIRKLGFDEGGGLNKVDATVTAYCDGASAPFKATIRHAN